MHPRRCACPITNLFRQVGKMDVIFLEEENNVDAESECIYTDISSIRHCYNKLHTHDYFELLLVAEGQFSSYVNGLTTIRKEGSLIFFRAADIHRIDPVEGHECHLINITYAKKTFYDLAAYLGTGFNAKYFLEAPDPPVVSLDEHQKKELIRKLNYLNTIPVSDKLQIRTSLRCLLMDVFYKYILLKTDVIKNDMPEWLSKLCNDLRQTEYLTAGTEALTLLSGKTHAYLCRMFKKYLNTTPTAFLNGLRLEYAGNLLLNSDKSVLDICYDAGFNNLGHFYKLFGRHFGMSPQIYRKRNWKNAHLWF